MNVQKFLQERGVPYEVISHQATYDAQRMSQAVHVSGHHVAKTVLLRAGENQLAVAVLPAAESIDFVKAGEAIGSGRTELATEVEMSDHCPDCEIGALPPFGSQYRMKTVVDEHLTKDREIIFEGNNHNEAIKMAYSDFARLENPIVAAIAASH